MSKPVLLIHGGGEGAYKADAKIASSLREKLGPNYEVRFPRMPNEDEPDYANWKDIILRELEVMGAGAILVGHSIGASVLIRLLTENALPQPASGAFLVAGPFWHDDQFWRWDEVALPADAAERYPAHIPLFIYHGMEDETVPVAHLAMYARALPHAVVRALPARDHQLNDDMTEVAHDIENLTND